MKIGGIAALLAVVCLVVYWPHKNAEFVLDDYYTVVRNPLIKDPSLYKDIWTSRLFDAHQSSGYIKFGYYRPLLQSSWILDYRLFGLKAAGYQWLNLLIHGLNCFLIYILWRQIFGQGLLALQASLLFCVLPTQEWVVRYVTGRGDGLSALFALASLICLLWVLKTGSPSRHSRESGNPIQFKIKYILVFVFWALSALTREVAITYILYAYLIFYSFPLSGEGKGGGISRFSLYWILIGILPLLVIGPIIPKQGNILAWHIFYFASMGLCLWMAQLRLRWFMLLFIFFAVASCYQGRFWTTEEALLRHTRSLECWPRTVVAQQLLMRYDDDIPGIKDLVNQAHDPLLKAMWLRRLGIVYFEHRDLSSAQEYFAQSLSANPSDVDTLDALAVVYHFEGQEAASLRCLNHALEINPDYPDTLKTLGIHYYLNKDYAQARLFLARCLLFDPDNHQAQDLLRLAKAAG